MRRRRATSSCTTIPTRRIADIVDRYHQVAERCDAVLIVGSDYTDVASPSELTRQRPHRGQPRRAGRARGAGQGPHARRGRPRRRAVPGRDRRPARPHRRGGGQPVRPGASWPRSPRRCERVEPEVLRAARGAAAGRAVGRASCATPSHGTLISGDEELLNREALGVLVAGMTAEHVLERLQRGHGGHHPRRPLRRRARRRQCACGRRLSVAVVHHPQRRPAAAPVDRRAGGRAWACGCRSSPPTSAPTTPRARSRRPAAG